MTPLFSKLNFPSFDKIFETRKFEEKSHIAQRLIFIVGHGHIKILAVLWHKFMPFEF